MRPLKYDEKMILRRVLMPNRIWNGLKQELPALRVETGNKSLSVSDLIRQGAEDLLKKLRNR